MESEDTLSEKEKKLCKNNFECFGEYGTRLDCKECPQNLACRNFSHSLQEGLYLRNKTKYRGRGKTRRKDDY